MSNVTDSYLAHHGILGMRWGHRKIDPFANHQANIQKRAEENGLSKKKALLVLLLDLLVLRIM